jgi:tetratricopeptide (TPR) repeat protein
MSILLVDLVPTSIDTLRSYLDDFQFYRLWTATSSDEALEVLKEQPLNLMIIGLKLKPMSGFQVLEFTRQSPKTKKLPVVMMLDLRDKGLEKKAIQMGVTGLINLPLEAKVVRGAVEQILEQFVDEEKEEFLQNITTARVAMRKGKLEKAEAGYRGALKVHPDMEAYLNLALILKKKEDYEGSQENYVAALRLNPDSLKAYLGLASVYRARGQLEEALKILATAVKISKKLKEEGSVSASIFFYMGEIELQAKHLQEAMGYFDQAGQEDSEDSGLQARIGDVLVEAGHAAEAESYYKRALEMDPELAHLYNRLGIAYRRQSKFEMAQNLYRKALAFHPEDENLIYNMARTFWEMKDYSQGVETISQALKINPEFPEAKQLLQACLKKLGVESVEQLETEVEDESAPAEETGGDSQ